MQKGWLPRSRAERLIALGRVILALTSMVAVWVDPSEPRSHLQLTYGLLAGYSTYAIAVLAGTMLTSGTTIAWRVGSHAFDMVVFTALVYFTDGPSSPFFAYFIFALFSAALRFGTRAIAYTAVVSVSAFVGIGGLLAFSRDDPFAAMNSFIMRSVYLVVVAIFLSYLVTYKERVLRELEAVVTWPRLQSPALIEIVTESLERVSRLIDAKRIVIVWDNPNSQRRFTAMTDDAGVFSCTALPEDEERIATPGGTEKGFMTVTALDRGGAVVHLADGTFHRDRGYAAAAAIRRRFQCRDVMAASFAGNGFAGWIFFLDAKERRLLEHLLVGEIVAALIAARLDHFFVQERVSAVAVSEDRMRVGRDLHDWLLQSLTGASFQLQSVHRLLTRDPAAAQERIREVQLAISSDQKELRRFIEQLQPGAAGPMAPLQLSARLESLAAFFRQQWGMDVVVDIDPGVHLVPDLLRAEIYSIVNEAVANAAKHSGATTVRVSLKIEAEKIMISVSDDGHGFPFHGQFTLEELVATKRGPVTLKQRISSLGGKLHLDSSKSGARLTIALPARMVRE